MIPKQMAYNIIKKKIVIKGNCQILKHMNFFAFLGVNLSEKAEFTAEIKARSAKVNG